MTEKGTSSLCRDRFVCAVCNWLLLHVASEWYRKMVGGALRLGLQTAAKPVSVESLLTDEDIAAMNEDATDGD